MFVKWIVENRSQCQPSVNDSDVLWLGPHLYSSVYIFYCWTAFLLCHLFSAIQLSCIMFSFNVEMFLQASRLFWLFQAQSKYFVPNCYTVVYRKVYEITSWAEKQKYIHWLTVCICLSVNIVFILNYIFKKGDLSCNLIGHRPAALTSNLLLPPKMHRTIMALSCTALLNAYDSQLSNGILLKAYR